jgi:sigma-E factor negative regulatory protein RseC
MDATTCREGIVIARRDDVITIQLDPAGSCGACPAKGACGVELSGAPRRTEIQAVDERDLEVGVRVHVDLSGTPALRISAVLFLLPVAGLVLGAFVGSWLLAGRWALTPDAAQALSGFAGLVLALVPVGIVELKRRDEIRRAIRVTRVDS